MVPTKAEQVCAYGKRSSQEVSWGQLWAQRQNGCYPQTPEVETSASWFVYTGHVGVFGSLTLVVLSFPPDPVRFVTCPCMHTLTQGFETQQTLPAVGEILPRCDLSGSHRQNRDRSSV